jgi:uncharacterized membrane protein YdjX (TVP38/TMEM64 family)
VKLGPRLQLGLMVAALVAAFVAFYGFDLLSIADVRAQVEPLGDWGAPAYLLLSAVLGVMLVPGPLLAGVSGLLFGPVLGTAVTIAASVASAVVSLVLARRFGRPGMAELSGARLTALAEQMDRHGTWAVIVQRLAPGIPDAPCSWLGGLLRIRPAQMALGTLIGAAPRGFSYTALGGSLDDLSSPIALAALAIIGLTGLLGAELGRRAYRRGRRAPSPGTAAPGPVDTSGTPGPPATGDTARTPSAPSAPAADGSRSRTAPPAGARVPD